MIFRKSNIPIHALLILLIFTAIFMNLHACITQQYCLSKSISYTETINYNGKEVLINLNIIQEPIDKDKINLTVRLNLTSQIKGLRINYTPPLLDYVIRYSDGRIRRWSEGKFFIQVILSKELPLSKSYSMIVDEGCLQFIVIEIRPLNYVRVIGVTEVAEALLSGRVKAVVMPKTYTVTQSRTPTTTPIKTLVNESLRSGISSIVEVKEVTKTVTTTLAIKYNLSRGLIPGMTTTTSIEKELFRVNITALTTALAIASLLAILIYIYMFRVKI